MQTANPATIAHLPDTRSGGEPSFLVLGGERPNLPGLNFAGRIGSPVAAIFLLGRVEPSELDAALEQAADPAVPVADFGDNVALRRDFIGSSLDSASLRVLQQHFSPIWRQLSELPFKVEREGRAEVTALRLAYSREAAIEASFAPDSRRLVEYRLLGEATGARHLLEGLADLDLLRRRHFTRTHVCPKCNSARLNAYEACPGCGGAELREETLVHHYRCGCQEAQSHFVQGQLLICPKCRRELRHLGVDYGKPGKAVVCVACGSANSEPLVQFACLDCAGVSPSDQTSTVDWYHYDLTEDGILALRHGRLPQFDIIPFLENPTHAYSPREFRLLATHELKVAARFARPFSVARFTVLNLEALLRDQGAVATDASFRRVVEAVVAALRTSDFVGVGAKHSMLIGFPGTSVKEFRVIEKRIRRAVDANSCSHVELGVEVVEGDAVIETLRRS